MARVPGNRRYNRGATARIYHGRYTQEFCVASR
jgi:hypothetical protein